MCREFGMSSKMSATRQQESSSARNSSPRPRSKWYEPFVPSLFHLSIPTSTQLHHYDAHHESRHLLRRRWRYRNRKRRIHVAAPWVTSPHIRWLRTAYPGPSNPAARRPARPTRPWSHQHSRPRQALFLTWRKQWANFSASACLPCVGLGLLMTSPHMKTHFWFPYNLVSRKKKFQNTKNVCSNQNHSLQMKAFVEIQEL